MTSRDEMERHAAIVNASRALVRIGQLYEYDLLTRSERFPGRLDELEAELWPLEPLGEGKA